MTFDWSVNIFALLSETTLSLLFLTAFLTDLDKHLPLSILFIMFLVCCLLAAALFVYTIQDHIWQRYFVQNVDIFNCRSETQALRTMVSLYNLIELTSQNQQEVSHSECQRADFLLRGFVEAHIEICDFP
jgi:hypothetical protein